jgi:hypothetical protein
MTQNMYNTSDHLYTPSAEALRMIRPPALRADSSADHLDLEFQLEPTAKCGPCHYSAGTDFAGWRLRLTMATIFKRTKVYSTPLSAPWLPQYWFLQGHSLFIQGLPLN